MANKSPLLTEQNKVVFIMGPTAAGKTATVMQLSQDYDVSVINADAAQVYQQMSIGTAKPSEQELRQTPHQLIDFVDPLNAYSAAEFYDDALQEIESAFAKQQTPVLVGGSMFYFKALESGLSPLPPADQEVRDEIEENARQLGWAALHQRLTGVDPVAAAKINQNDPQRIQRALEIYKLTGLPPTQFYAQSQSKPMPYSVVKIALMPCPRAVLHQRIELRFEQMLKAGLIEEVERLRMRGDLSLQLSSMRTVGYRQVWQYLEGALNHRQMVDQAVAATRQLAKRQLTWLRNQAGIVWFVGYNGIDYGAIRDYFAKQTLM